MTSEISCFSPKYFGKLKNELQYVRKFFVRSTEVDITRQIVGKTIELEFRMKQISAERILKFASEFVF